MARSARRDRQTKETQILVELDLDGTGRTQIGTGVGFFDHLLEQLGRHSGFDLTVKASGDLHVDSHHTVEDAGLALGEALAEALGDKDGITRYGHAVIPMDETLVRCVIDLSGRPYLAYDVPVAVPAIGTFDPGLAEEFLRAFVNTSKMTLHLTLLDGANAHHIVECAFKAVARALGEACSPSGRSGTPSTKGVL